MLQKLKELLLSEDSKTSKQSNEKKLQQACAALLVEVLRADFKESDDELVTLKQILQSSFSLTKEELEELITSSLENGKNQTSLHPFTSLINDHYDYEKRLELITFMWKMAFSDGKLDKYEDSVIRKSADLLYIRHSDFIKTKLATDT
jgi:uncharacterized tellurite resistance protein B-like protein